jgi:hypothetical protein
MPFESTEIKSYSTVTVVAACCCRVYMIVSHSSLRQQGRQVSRSYACRKHGEWQGWLRCSSSYHRRLLDAFSS